MPSLSPAERRARLAQRHHLAPARRGDDPVVVASDLVGLHSTDPATVFLALRARTRLVDPAAIEAALYEHRVLVRMIGMRRTLFVLPAALAPIVQAACTREIAARQRRGYARQLEQAGIAADGLAWLDEAAAATQAALEERGEAFATELTAAVPMLRERIRFGEGKRWAGSQGMTSWVLFLLAADGRVVRGRPRGRWTGSQWRWTPVATWLGAPFTPLDPEVARAELARSWLRSYGPATLVDLKWWSGWTLAQSRSALTAIGGVEVDLQGTAGVVLPDDVAPTPAPEPWAALLPALDPTVMGWKERGWYLGEHEPALFDRAGNAGPTVWWDGRVVGGWVQRADGEIAVRLLADVGADARAAIDEETVNLASWLGDTVVTPRFRTPLERELGT